MTFCEKIKAARLEQLLTQKEMAAELGVSLISIIRWENDQNIPTLSTQRKFRDYCKSNKMTFNEDKK